MRFTDDIHNVYCVTYIDHSGVLKVHNGLSTQEVAEFLLQVRKLKDLTVSTHPKNSRTYSIWQIQDMDIIDKLKFSQLLVILSISFSLYLSITILLYAFL